MWLVVNKSHEMYQQSWQRRLRELAWVGGARQPPPESVAKASPSDGYYATTSPGEDVPTNKRPQWEVMIL